MWGGGCWLAALGVGVGEIQRVCGVEVGVWRTSEGLRLLRWGWRRTGGEGRWRRDVYFMRRERLGGGVKGGSVGGGG